jgi:hypothetical protein
MASQAKRMDFSKDRKADCAGMSSRWTPLRKAAYALHGIQEVQAKDLPGTRVAVLDSQLDERGINNTQAILDGLRRSWKRQIVVESVFYQQYSAVQQLRMLAQTSVLISNVGSRSFRMLFLPEGAQVCTAWKAFRVYPKHALGHGASGLQQVHAHFDQLL